MHTLARTLVVAALGFAPGVVSAGAVESPYAGQDSRAIKALSAEEIATLREGTGMGLAKAAELNHYPGPAHVLELADRLELTAGQRRRTETVFRRMQTRAKMLGVALIAAEHDLDREFAEGRATATAIGPKLSRIGELQAALRAAHLEAHLAQRDILSPRQIARYDELRGYNAASDDPHQGHAGHAR